MDLITDYRFRFHLLVFARTLMYLFTCFDFLEEDSTGTHLFSGDPSRNPTITAHLTLSLKASVFKSASACQLQLLLHSSHDHFLHVQMSAAPWMPLSLPSGRALLSVSLQNYCCVDPDLLLTLLSDTAPTETLHSFLRMCAAILAVNRPDEHIIT